MNHDSILVNRVAASGIITLNLEQYYPKTTIVGMDLKSYLFRELILKELEFRQTLKDLDWSVFQSKVIAVYCSNDAIIPTWAYMLVAKYGAECGARVVFGTPEEVLRILFHESLLNQDWSTYQDKKIVVKGCSDKEVPASAYLLVTEYLLPYAASIMYGEPCSTVPVYKKTLAKTN